MPELVLNLSGGKGVSRLRKTSSGTNITNAFLIHNWLASSPKKNPANSPIQNGNEPDSLNISRVYVTDILKQQSAGDKTCNWRMNNTLLQGLFRIISIINIRSCII